MSEAWQAGSVKSVLGLDTDPFAQGMLKAQSIAQLFPQTVQAFLANPLLGVVSLAKDAAGAIQSAFGALNDVVHRVAAGADNAVKAADRAGVSVEFYSSLGRVAAMAGGSIEGLDDSFKFLLRSAAEAASGNATLSESFRQAGVAVTDAAGDIRPANALILDLADGIAAIQDPAMRTKLAMDLLGRSGAGSLNLLAGGSASIRQQMQDMEDLGATISESMARGAEAFNDFESIVGYAWEGIQNTISRPILEWFGRHYDELVQAVKTGSEVIRSVIATTWDAIAARLQIPIVADLQERLEELALWVRTHPVQIRMMIERALEAIQAAFRKATEVLRAAGEAVRFLADHWRMLATVIGGALLVSVISRAAIAVQSLTQSFGALGVSIRSAMVAAAGFNLSQALLLAGAGGALGYSASATFGPQGGDNAKLGGAIGGALGAVGGFMAGGPLGAAAGWAGGATIGHQFGKAIDDAYRVDQDLGAEGYGRGIRRLESSLEKLKDKELELLPGLQEAMRAAVQFGDEGQRAVSEVNKAIDEQARNVRQAEDAYRELMASQDFTREEAVASLQQVVAATARWVAAEEEAAQKLKSIAKTPIQQITELQQAIKGLRQQAAEAGKDDLQKMFERFATAPGLMAGPGGVLGGGSHLLELAGAIQQLREAQAAPEINKAIDAVFAQAAEADAQRSISQITEPIARARAELDQQMQVALKSYTDRGGVTQEQIDRYKEGLERFKQISMDARLDEMARWVIEAAKTPMDKYIETIEQLEALRDAGKIDNDVFAASERQAQQMLGLDAMAQMEGRRVAFQRSDSAEYRVARANQAIDRQAADTQRQQLLKLVDQQRESNRHLAKIADAADRPPEPVFEMGS